MEEGISSHPVQEGDINSKENTMENPVEVAQMSEAGVVSAEDTNQKGSSFVISFGDSTKPRAAPPPLRRAAAGSAKGRGRSSVSGRTGRAAAAAASGTFKRPKSLVSEVADSTETSAPQPAPSQPAAQPAASASEENSSTDLAIAPATTSAIATQEQDSLSEVLHKQSSLVSPEDLIRTDKDAAIEAVPIPQKRVPVETVDDLASKDPIGTTDREATTTANQANEVSQAAPTTSEGAEEAVHPKIQHEGGSSNADTAGLANIAPEGESQSMIENEEPSNGPTKIVTENATATATATAAEETSSEDQRVIEKPRRKNQLSTEEIDEIIRQLREKKAIAQKEDDEERNEIYEVIYEHGIRKQRLHCAHFAPIKHATIRTNPATPEVINLSTFPSFTHTAYLGPTPVLLTTWETMFEIVPSDSKEHLDAKGQEQLPTCEFMKDPKPPRPKKAEAKEDDLNPKDESHGQPKGLFKEEPKDSKGHADSKNLSMKISFEDSPKSIERKRNIGTKW